MLNLIKKDILIIKRIFFDELLCINICPFLFRFYEFPH